MPQGAEAEIILDRTPFYPEGGGQVSDSGVITSASGQLYVTEVRRAPSGVIVHRGRVGSGVLRVESEALATVDEEERLDTARHHTATHLLHQALRDILGDHASQAGSLVAPDRLRFDFTHFEPVDSDTLLAIESRVNEHVLANHAVSAQVMSFDEARKAGAIALFGEKYGDRVRVVSIGNYSKELCGGTHVQQSGELGLFKIVTEGGVASGVRRIEAVCGSHALRHVESESAALRQVSKLVRAAPLETPQQIERLLDQIKSLEQEIDRLQARVASARTAELAEQAVEVDGIRLLAVEVEDTDMGALRVLGDAIRNRLGPSAFVLGSRHGGKAQLVAMASDEAVDRGIRAVEVIRKVAPIVGGGGGGHERMAQAGGKDPGRMREALDEARSFLHTAIESRQVNR